MKFRTSVYLGSALALSGCAGFTSTPITTANKAPDGIIYYMPKRPILVQVSLDAAGKKTVSVPAQAVSPDLTHAYVLDVPRNLINDNHATIEVSPLGLLKSAATDQTSGVDALVKAIATNLGTLSALAVREAVPVTCQPSATYSVLIWPKEDKGKVIPKLCDFQISFTALGGTGVLTDNARAAKSDTASGIFYKSERPYLVTVTGNGTPPQSFIASSPDEAPIQFLPLQLAFFAKNTSTFKLDDGILNKAESNIGGELPAAVALPASAISAYMTAVGDIFSSLKTNEGKESDQALSRARLDLCKATVAANPLDWTHPDQAQTSFAAIKAACGP